MSDLKKTDPSLEALPDKPDGNEVVTHELIVVLPWFLEAEKKNEELLNPEGCLHEVVRLELRLHLPVRVTYNGACDQKVTIWHRWLIDLSRMSRSCTSMSAAAP